MSGVGGDHLYTTSVSERDGEAKAQGYGYEGVACYVKSEYQSDLCRYRDRIALPDAA